jgi:hypothetical protein
MYRCMLLHRVTTKYQHGEYLLSRMTGMPLHKVLHTYQCGSGGDSAVLRYRSSHRSQELNHHATIIPTLIGREVF